MVPLKMTSRDFCYWLLQGFFEISGFGNGPLDEMSLAPEQAKMIRDHLNLVFKHEIDPSNDGGDPEKRLELQRIHDGVPKAEFEKKLAEAIEKHEKSKPHASVSGREPRIMC